jgi:hypothetical protein
MPEVLCLLSIGMLAGSVRADEQASAHALAAAAPNTWVRILEAKTGGREQPVFVYAAKIRRFVMAAGMQTYGGVRPRHYDTEEFDLARCKWLNAYPPGMQKSRPESGPVGEEYAKQRAMQGYNGRQLFYKDGDHLRLGAGGQWNNSKTYGEYCYVPEGGEGGSIYVYMWGKHTLRYDVSARTWEDLGTEPRARCRLWGSMCYDPVNREILHAGGAGGTAEIGTWVYDIDKNQWRELDFGSVKRKRLFEQAAEVCWQAKVLLGRCASRHAVAETPQEAQVDLSAEAQRLVGAAEKLAGEVKTAGLEAHEEPVSDVAVRRLASAASAVKAVGPRLSGTITPAQIAEVRSARVLFEQVVDALAPEPPGRARSQIAYDEANRKIVLFGGDGLDRALSDTWVYDCKTRTWEQKFPDRCPSPRAGHILAWLPKARRIVLAGGYSRVPLAQEIWTYDTATNQWTPLLHVPPVRERGRDLSPGCPNVTAREFQFGAVNEDDVLVCPNGNDVWACRVDPQRPAEGADAATAATPGSYVFNRIAPATWENAARPDPQRSRKFPDGLPVNQWTAFEFPKYAPGARNRWGTTAYDADRHQLLFWGGGHATSHENDVAHFSVQGGFWTIGYHPDDPIEKVYATQPTPISFRNRVHVPIHAYKAYCYDPTVRKMLYFDRAYDPLVREWMPMPYPGLSHRGPMRSHMESTPKGAVVYSDRGLFRLDAKRERWQRLPWTGPPFGRIWCDGHGLCYDAKRDCLWLANDKTVVRYDLATGRAQALKVKKPAAIGRWMLWSEQVYLPDADLILLMRLFGKPDGGLANVAWSPKDARYYWVDLPFVSGDRPVTFGENPFSWHDAIRYDPKLQLVLINNSRARRVWGMKFDRETAEMTEMKTD